MYVCIPILHFLSFHYNLQTRMGIRWVFLIFLSLLILPNLGFGFGLVQRCQNAERKVLIKLKRSLNHSIIDLSSWNGENCCEWFGVTCDSATGLVNGLGFEDPYALIPELVGSLKHLTYLKLRGFSGKVPHSIGNLTRLRTLDLSSEDDIDTLTVDNLDWVSGLLNLQHLELKSANLSNALDSLQVLGKLPRLQHLGLSYCNLGNSHHLSHAFNNSAWLPTLEYLDLSFNSFQGPLPPFFANMSSLRFLDLSFNNFTGSIPMSWLRNMRELESLSLSYNSLSRTDGGSIMGIILNLCNLKVMDLSHNSIQAELVGAHEKYNYSSKCITYDLETLRLSKNNIAGNLPHWLGILKNLKTLDLEDNKLVGQIPSTVGNLSLLKQLSLSGNNFSGSIPPSIGRLSSLHWLDLSNNILSGHIPESLGQCRNLTKLDLSLNSLQGFVSDNHLANLSSLEFLILRSNSLDFNFTSEWRPPFQLIQFHMSSCRITGQLPPWILAQHELYALDLSQNEISGKMPDLSQNQGLTTLNLSYNRIAGPITYFPALIKNIDLSQNLLSGPLQHLPTGRDIYGYLLCELLDLRNNSLSGAIPHDYWVNASLYAIDLSYNKLSGIIPASIFMIPDLAYLSLNNNLLDGKIPTTINSGKLVSLDLGENKLSGTIPSFGEDTRYNLEIIRLRGNHLEGVIPQQLCSLSRLRILDIAQNNLTGKIPHCFGHLTALLMDIFWIH